MIFLFDLITDGDKDDEEFLSFIEACLSCFIIESHRDHDSNSQIEKADVIATKFQHVVIQVLQYYRV